MRKPIGLSAPMRPYILTETPEEKEVFSAMEQSSVRKEGIRQMPKRTWVDLTDDEMLMIYGQNHEGKKYNLGRMVQQALKEKNT